MIKLLKAAIDLIGLLQASNSSAQRVEIWVLSPDAAVLGRGADELFESVRNGKLLRYGGAIVADAGGMFVDKRGPEHVVNRRRQFTKLLQARGDDVERLAQAVVWQ